MELLRMICYVGAVLMCVALVGQLLRIRHPLARLLAVAMIAWVVNAAMLLSFLGHEVATGTRAPWRSIATTINAILIVAIPSILYAWFLRVNGQGKHES